MTTKRQRRWWIALTVLLKGGGVLSLGQGCSGRVQAASPATLSEEGGEGEVEGSFRPAADEERPAKGYASVPVAADDTTASEGRHENPAPAEESQPESEASSPVGPVRCLSGTLWIEKDQVCAHVAFVTSRLYDGNLGGIEGADRKCQEAAGSEFMRAHLGLANLAASFKALLFLPDESTSRFTSDNPVYLVNRQTRLPRSLQEAIRQRTGAGIFVRSVSLTEEGKSIREQGVVWLGGRWGEPKHSCRGWTDGQPRTGWVVTLDQHPGAMLMRQASCVDSGALVCISHQ